MPFSIDQWHQRFTTQARWTASLRAYFLRRVFLRANSRVLEVGCGTGAVLGEISAPADSPEGRVAAWDESSLLVHGLDIQAPYLHYAARRLPHADFVQGDGLRLPYAPACFDLCLCHFLLLWVSDARQVVQEMQRVTRPGGAVLALAEPDYGGRIDYPLELADIGILQAEALHDQGADIAVGRKLGEIFSQAGLKHIEVGVMGGQWHGAPSQADWQSEWEVLAADLQGRFASDELVRLKEIDRKAWQESSRVLYVPTFYAYGMVV